MLKKNNIKIAYYDVNRIYIMKETEEEALETIKIFVINGISYINEILYYDNKMFVYADSNFKSKSGKLFYFNYDAYFYRNDNDSFNSNTIEINVDTNDFIFKTRINNFKIYNEKIYFTLDEGISHMYCMTFDGVDISKVFDDKVLCQPWRNSIIFHDNIIYYINISDNDKLYYFNMATKEKDIVYKESIYHIELENNKIYFMSQNNKAGYYDTKSKETRIYAECKNSHDYFKFFHGAIVSKNEVINSQFIKKIYLAYPFSHEDVWNIECLDDNCYIYTRYMVDDYGSSEEGGVLYKLTWDEVCDYKSEEIYLSGWEFEATKLIIFK